MSIGLCALLVLALIMMSMGIPLAFLAGAMVFSAAAGLTTGSWGSTAWFSTESFSLLAVPLFILAGTLMEHSGIAGALVDWGQRLTDKEGKGEVGAAPEDVAEELSELLEELNGIRSEDVLTAAAYFHAKFENIHPFADGNGRTGRLAMNYLLVLHGHPPIIIHEEDRQDYYRTLEAWDTQAYRGRGRPDIKGDRRPHQAGETEG